MIILVQPGDRIVVQLDQTDGQFDIEYDHEDSGRLTIKSNFPDSSGRDGIIYEEIFHTPDKYPKDTGY